jgi:ribonuclease VapC
VIVDASALLAIAFNEPDADRFAAALAGSDGNRMSAVNFVEAAVRIDQLKDEGIRAAFAAIVAASNIVVAPVSAEQAHIARTAYRTFGKGNHRARLNFGDCFAYALAKETGEPLLFKGGDFAETDVTPAA